MNSNQQHDVFHLATKKQLQYIRDGLNRISLQIWDSLAEESMNIYILYDKNPQIFLVPHKMERHLKLIKDHKILQHTGIFFGFFKGTEFMLSLEGAELLYSDLFKTRHIKLKTVTVSEDAAKSFLYGNMLTPSDFTQKPKTLKRKDVLFVLNPQNEFIGIGFIYKRDDRIELRNLIDYGYYIRRGH